MEKTRNLLRAHGRALRVAQDLLLAENLRESDEFGWLLVRRSKLVALEDALAAAAALQDSIFADYRPPDALAADADKS